MCPRVTPGSYSGAGLFYATPSPPGCTGDSPHLLLQPGGGDLGLGLGERGESVKGDSTSALASFQARNFLLLHKGKLQGIKSHVIKIQCTSPSCPNDGCFFLRRLCFSGKAMAQTGCTEQLQEL